MTVEATDERSQAVQVPGTARVTLDYMKSQIIDNHTFVLGEAISHLPGMDPLAPDHPTHVMTVCVLTMSNGFVLLGKSAPMDPANFNAEHGAKLAFDQALQQAWPLYAFARLQAATEGW